MYIYIYRVYIYTYIHVHLTSAIRHHCCSARVSISYRISLDARVSTEFLSSLGFKTVIVEFLRVSKNSYVLIQSLEIPLRHFEFET